MVYREETRDLFSVPDDYYFAHCISADFGMGKGIVIEFNKRFNMKMTLQEKYPDYYSWFFSQGIFGSCILEGRVLNLVTKQRYWHKPSMMTMQMALLKMKELCLINGIAKVAMPTIGAGLDRLPWDAVSGEIQAIFSDTDIEILICKRPNN